VGQASVISRLNRTPRELNQGGTSTSEVVFTSDGTLPVLCHLPAAEKLASANNTTSVMFRVLAWGQVTGGTTANYTPQLQFGTSATASSNTDIDSGTAVAVNSNNGQWFTEALLIWDTVSDTIDGISRNAVFGSTRTLTAWAAIDNSVTADPSANTEFAFVMTGTFSAGNASNTATLGGFQIEEV